MTKALPIEFTPGPPPPGRTLPVQSPRDVQAGDLIIYRHGEAVGWMMASKFTEFDPATMTALRVLPEPTDV